MKKGVAILTVLVVAFATVSFVMFPAFAGNGNGASQGGSGSNPDGGGVDKDYDADGEPARSQHDGSPDDDLYDGNNGCGQDKKVEGSEDPSTTDSDHVGWDDNNGWCGKPHENGQSAARPAKVKAAEVLANKDENAFVAGEQGAAQPAQTRVLGVKLQQQTQVLGAGGVRGLPLTGGNLALLATLAVPLILAGAVSVRAARKRTAA